MLWRRQEGSGRSQTQVRTVPTGKEKHAWVFCLYHYGRDFFPRLYGFLRLFDGTPVSKNVGKEGRQFLTKQYFMELAHARFIYFHCWWREYVVVNTFLFLTGGRHNWYEISVFLTLEVSYRNLSHRWRDSICIDGQIILLWWRDSICLSSLIFLRFGGTAYKCIIVFWVPGDRWRDSICLLEHVI